MLLKDDFYHKFLYTFHKTTYSFKELNQNWKSINKHLLYTKIQLQYQDEMYFNHKFYDIYLVIVNNILMRCCIYLFNNKFILLQYIRLQFVDGLHLNLKLIDTYEEIFKRIQEINHFNLSQHNISLCYKRKLLMQ